MSNHGRKNISEVTIVKALKMVEDGYSYSLVAEEIGCNKSLIGKWVKKAGIKPNTKIAKTYDRQKTHVKQDWSKVTDLQTLLAQERERVIELAVNELSQKPRCTEESPCGCHFGEVFHADGKCACDIKVELLQSLSSKETK